MSQYQLMEINGAKIALYPIKEVRSILVEIRIKAGSWYEEGSNWGAFHFLEHLISQGTQKFPTYKDIENFRVAHGISYNAWTSGRAVGFWFKFPDVSENEGLDFIDQIIFHPTFLDNNFSKEISVINQEYCEKWNNPNAHFEQAALENLLGHNHLFSRDALGQIDYIKTINHQDLLKLHQSFFQPKNFCLSVVGNFKKDNIQTKLSYMFKKIKNTNNKVVLKLSPPKPQNHYFNYYDQVQQSRLIVSWLLNPGKKLDLQTRYGVNILKYLLGGDTNSILFRKIRQELGLIYNIKSSFFIWPKINGFEIRASVEVKNIPILLKEIEKNLNEFLDNLVNNSDFNQARNYMDLQTLMNFDSIGNIACDLVNDLFYENKIYLPEERIKIAKKININKIKDVIKPELNWSRAYISVLIPKI